MDVKTSTTTNLMKTPTRLSFKTMKYVSPKVTEATCNPWCQLPSVIIETSVNSDSDNDQALIQF